MSARLVDFLATLTNVVRKAQLTAERVDIVFEVTFGTDTLEYVATDIIAAPGQARVKLRRLIK